MIYLGGDAALNFESSGYGSYPVFKQIWKKKKKPYKQYHDLRCKRPLFYLHGSGSAEFLPESESDLENPDPDP